MNFHNLQVFHFDANLNANEIDKIQNIWDLAENRNQDSVRKSMIYQTLIFRDRTYTMAQVLQYPDIVLETNLNLPDRLHIQASLYTFIWKHIIFGDNFNDSDIIWQPKLTEILIGDFVRLSSNLEFFSDLKFDDIWRYLLRSHAKSLKKKQ